MEPIDEIFDSINDRVNEFKENFVKNGNAEKVGVGLGGFVGVASMTGEASIAAEVGGLIVAATGGAVGIGLAAPVAAIGIGYLTYRVAGGFARKAIREIDYQIEQNKK